MGILMSSPVLLVPGARASLPDPTTSRALRNSLGLRARSQRHPMPAPPVAWWYSRVRPTPKSSLYVLSPGPDTKACVFMFAFEEQRRRQMLIRDCADEQGKCRRRRRCDTCPARINCVRSRNSIVGVLAARKKHAGPLRPVLTSN